MTINAGNPAQAELVTQATGPEPEVGKGQIRVTNDEYRISSGKDASSAATLNHAPAELINETAQLKATVQTMRNQMEAMSRSAHTAMQAAVANAEAEITQLRDVIVSLRDKLEIARRDAAASAERAAKIHAQERGNLQRQIVVLRQKLEGSE